MRFPIDVVYLNQERRVVYIRQNLRPWRIAAVRQQASSVLELPGNSLDSTGTNVGDEIDIIFDKVKEEIPS
jgi:uncharacterized membrane protein (UPF0127 family)